VGSGFASFLSAVIRTPCPPYYGVCTAAAWTAGFAFMIPTHPRNEKSAAAELHFSCNWGRIGTPRTQRRFFLPFTKN
jgi:hypothetical protein